MKKPNGKLMIRFAAIMQVGLLVMMLFAESVRATTVSVLLLETPLSITVTPVDPSININGEKQFIAIANFADDSTLDITRDALSTWSSSNASIATIIVTGSYGGLSTGLAAGTVTIKVTYGGKTGQTNLTVLPIVEPPLPPPPPGGGGGGGSGPPILPPSEEPPIGEEEPPGPPPPGEEEVPPFVEPPEEEVLPVFEEPPEEVSPPGELPPTGEVPPDTTILPDRILRPDEVVPDPRLGLTFLGDEWGLNRGEVMKYINDEFDLDLVYADLLDLIEQNIDEALNIFLGVTNFTGVITDLDRLQLFPDVPYGNEYWYPVNVGALLSIVQGYYEESDSPFLPYRVISRIEATKVLLGTFNMIEWMYYPEIEAILGGEDGVKAQTTPFVDIWPQRGGQWWYPRYVTLACEVKLFNCRPGTELKPDEFLTEAEFLEMVRRLRAYFVQTGYLEIINQDRDGDGIKNYLEQYIYFTDPEARDMDGDRLTDGDEIFKYKTSPFLKDSDAEGLTDYEEVIIHKTDPLDYDTDDDLFSDYLEVMAGSDPLDPDSYPPDLNNNGVDDDWEKKYGIDVLDGIQDTDGDGVSDKLEYLYGTNPLNKDTDGDGLTDAEEIFVYGTDPLDPLDPGNLENIGVKITSFTENQLVGDTTPLIRGVAPAGAEVRLLLRNDYGHERVLGSTFSQENSVFLFQVDKPLRDGRYMLVARALQPEKKRIMDSAPVHIIIDSTLQVVPPTPKKLAEEVITEEVILKNLRVKIRDNKPVLMGETQYGNRVSATWASYVMTSALIADSVTGEFEIAAPDVLTVGNHMVYVTATRVKDNAQSETINVGFTVLPPSILDSLIRQAAEEGPQAVTGVMALISSPSVLLWILLILAVLLGLGYMYFFVLKKKAKDKRKDL